MTHGNPSQVLHGEGDAGDLPGKCQRFLDEWLGLLHWERCCVRKEPCGCVTKWRPKK